jgi:hypothetical protein
MKQNHIFKTKKSILMVVAVTVLLLAGVIWLAMQVTPAKRPLQHGVEPTPGGGTRLPAAQPAAPFKVTRQQVAALVDAYPAVAFTNVPAPVKPDTSVANSVANDESVKRQEQAQAATNAAEVYGIIFAQLKTGPCKKIMDRLKELIGKRKYTELTPAEKEEFRNALNSPEMRETPGTGLMSI